MGEAFLDYKKGGSGLDINGIIQDYYVYAGTNVNAGDFVEFVNGVAGQTTETSINKAISSTNLYGGKLSACKLTNNTVFIAHGTNSEDASGNKLIGVVCTISGTTITAGTHTQLSTRNWAGSRISLVALSSTKVFIAHSYGSSTASYTLYGLVCDISGTTITTGSDVSVVDTNYSGYAMSVTRLSSTKVFIAYCNNSSGRYLYGIVCTVSDTTIAQGTKTKLNGDTTYTGSCVSATTLSSTKVFIAHSYSTSGYLYGMVCIISDTTITHGTDTALVTENTGFHISAVALSSTKVFIAHALVNNYLWGIVCTISDATITKGTDTLLKDSLHSAYTLFVSKYTSDSALILHGTSDTASSSYLYGMICPVSGTTITAGADVKISDVAYSGAVFSSVFLDSEKLFVAHSGTSNYVMWGRMLKAENNALTNQFTTTNYETQVRPATTLPCNGVASTSGVGGDSTGHKDMVSVYQPLEAFNLVVNGDFEDGLNGWALGGGSEKYLNIEHETLDNYNCMKVTVIANYTSNLYFEVRQQMHNIKAEHIYYLSCMTRGKNTNVEVGTSGTHAYIGLVNTPSVLAKTEEWTLTSARRAVDTVEGDGYLYLRAINSANALGNEYYFRDVKLYDLTAMFGAGNEPTKEWCDANL